MSEKHPAHVAFYKGYNVRRLKGPIEEWESDYFLSKHFKELKNISDNVVKLCDFKGARNYLENKRDLLVEMSTEEYLQDRVVIVGHFFPLKRADHPFKIIDFVPIIVLKAGNEVYYDGEYSEINRVYYDIEKDTLCCDTSFAEGTVDDDDLYIKATNLRSETLILLNRYIAKYDKEIEEVKNQINKDKESRDLEAYPAYEPEPKEKKKKHWWQ